MGGGRRESTGAALADLRAASPVVRLLVLTQLAFNIGFFMVLPYLSVHLTDDLGLAAALVGLTLGLRTFSQQGLFVVGGLLADRWGTKPVVLTGCAVRVAGFVGLAVAESVPAVLTATVLVGFAAALFSPAVESALAQETARDTQGPDRLAAFSLFSISGEIGAFGGPLLGALLLLVDFRAACLVGAGVFVAVLLAHLRWLPRRPAEHAGDRPLDGWREATRNRRFLLFALAYSGQLVAYNQLYLLLPLEVERVWGSQSPLAWLFALSALLVVVGQLRVTRWSRGRDEGSVLAVGFAVMAGAFLVVVAALPAGPRGWAGLVPLGVFVALLTLGQMVVMPLARALVPRLGAERRLGAYYGVLASVSGLAVLVGSTGLGGVVQLSAREGAGLAVPWLVAATVPVASAFAVRHVLCGLAPVTAVVGPRGSSASSRPGPGG